MGEGEEGLAGRTLGFGEDRGDGRDERGLEEPPDGCEGERRESPEGAREGVGAVEAAERQRRSEEDGGGEVVPDREEAVGRGDEVEEETGVQPFQEVVGGSYRALDNFAQGVESVRALGGDGVDGDSVDSVLCQYAVGGARAPEGSVLEVLDERCRARRVAEWCARVQRVRAGVGAAEPARDVAADVDDVLVREAAVDALCVLASSRREGGKCGGTHRRTGRQS